MGPPSRPPRTQSTASHRSEGSSAAASAAGSMHGADPKRHLSSVAQQKAPPPRPPSRSGSITGTNTGKQPTQRTGPDQSTPAVDKFYSAPSSELLSAPPVERYSIRSTHPKSQLKISPIAPLLRATSVLPLGQVILPPIQENAAGAPKFRPHPIRFHQGRVHLSHLRVPPGVRVVMMRTTLKVQPIMANPMYLLIPPVVGVAAPLQPPDDATSTLKKRTHLLHPRQGTARLFSQRTSPRLNPSTAGILVEAPLATPQKNLAPPIPGGVAPKIPLLPPDTPQRHKSTFTPSILQAIPIYTLQR